MHRHSEWLEQFFAACSGRLVAGTPAMSEAPRELRVSSPSGPRECEGTYTLVVDQQAGGMPVWRHSEGRRWIYSMSSGKWAIGGEAEEEQDFDSEGAYMFCPELHRGRLPHEVRSPWLRNNPMWTSDVAIRVFVPEPEHKSAKFARTPRSKTIEEMGEAMTTIQLEGHDAAVATAMGSFVRKTLHESTASPTNRHERRIHSSPVLGRWPHTAAQQAYRHTVMDRGVSCESRHTVMDRGAPPEGILKLQADRRTIHPVQLIDTSLNSSLKSQAAASLGSTLKSQAWGDSRRSKRKVSVAEWVRDRVSGKSPISSESALLDLTISREKGCMFANPDMMKAKLRENAAQPKYNVQTLYKKSGVFQAIARSWILEHLTLFVVVLNTIWIGYELDANTADTIYDSEFVFQVVENVFCAFFAGELLVRLFAFKRCWRAVTDFQFDFDLLLLSLMIFETWLPYAMYHAHGGGAVAMEQVDSSSLTILRCLRLTKMCRLIRIFHAVPELMMIIQGLVCASKAVSWTLLLMGMAVYVFAITFRILTRSTKLGETHFPTVPQGMATLLLPGLLPDNADVAEEMGNENIMFAVLFILFIVVASLMLMNMLIGVLCEGVTSVAAVEREEMSVRYVRESLEQLLESLGLDTQICLTPGDVETLLTDPVAIRVISSVGVDPEGLVEIAEFHLFSNRGTITFSEFVALVLQLRGHIRATVTDLVNLRKFLVDEMRGLEGRLTDLFREAPCGAPHEAPCVRSSAHDFWDIPEASSFTTDVDV